MITTEVYKHGLKVLPYKGNVHKIKNSNEIYFYWRTFPKDEFLDYVKYITTPNINVK